MSLFSKKQEEKNHAGRIQEAEKQYDNAIQTFVDAQEGVKEAINELSETKAAVLAEIKELQGLVEDTDRRLERNTKLDAKLAEFLS